MSTLIGSSRGALSVGVDDNTPQRWRAEVRTRTTALAADWCPGRRDLIEMVDRRLRVSRSLRRAEREALGSILGRWVRGTRDIKLKRLREARAFVGLLAEMGFADDEVVLGVTGLRGAGLMSSEVHSFFAGRGAALHLSGRGSWRGSLTVRLAPRGHGTSRAALDAARFAVLMMAIDADPLALDRAVAPMGQGPASTRPRPVVNCPRTD